MTRERIKQVLKNIIAGRHDEKRGDCEIDIALKEALKSLQAWDKVIKKLEEELDDEASKEALTYSYGRGDGIKDCLDIIKEYLGEVEE
jgi:hypothetical protein